ncbi:MAG: hypothetical protein WDW38_008987 [Sanguina aurantia]
MSRGLTHLSSSSSSNSYSSEGSSSRRTALLGFQTSALLLLPLGTSVQPVRAAIVDEEVSSAVFTTAAPSVVSIQIIRRVSDGVESQDGVGSGVVWDNSNHILTNFHCISMADKSGQKFIRVGVTSSDARAPTISYPASIVAMDAAHDIAVLRIESESMGAESNREISGLGGVTAVSSSSSSNNGEGQASAAYGLPLLQPITMTPSKFLKVGQSVFAIGNTYGLSKTMTSGVVSGLGRTIPSTVGTRITGVIQTDASISAGNSGGPLLDSAGHMVGLNTATFTRSGTGRGSGVNFAIPSDMLIEMVPNLIVYKNVYGKM